MNILIPNTWLREYLKTQATPKQIKDCLSLCGPSVERINDVNGEIVYDIEITGNRPDAMSVSGIAREASVILPRFGIPATFLHDPYAMKHFSDKAVKPVYDLTIKTDPVLNPRFTMIVLDDVKVGESPNWMKQYLTLAGIRSLNNIIDITNYLMHAFGQPVHAFDYDKIGRHTLTLRPSRKGERVTTLDEKTHTLPGGDIIIEDGDQRLIDLCGIMGGNNSKITDDTTRVVLFVQTYNPVNIRKTSMALAHRTDAAGLFEKDLDTELVMPTITKGIELIEELAGGKPKSKLYDFYPNPYKQKSVSVERKKVDSYMGIPLKDGEIKKILEPLGFHATITKQTITVDVPSFRRDIAIDVDVIEEIARIYGYHNIETRLPDTEPPVAYMDPELSLEQQVKNKLCDWGYTETYTYSMISEKLMDIFHLDKTKSYTITNPLSDEWVYMRPSLLPSMLMAIKQNLSFEGSLKLFELSNVYEYRKNTIPHEKPTLIVAVTGKQFFQLKGLTESLFSLLGVPFPNHADKKANEYYNPLHSLRIGDYGYVGEIHSNMLERMEINKPITVLELHFEHLIEQMKPTKQYHPIPKYPASYEDIAFVVPDQFHVGPLIEAVKTADPLVSDVSLLDTYANTKTLHITYQSREQNLESTDIAKVRNKILSMAAETFGIKLKSL